jgi:glycosyltransferase involved in cell wall biosynthesis
MSKINVLQVCNQLGVGGTEKALQNFSEHLNKKYFNVSICGLLNGGLRATLLQKKGFDVDIVFSDQQRLIDLLREKDIDIVHIHRSGKEEPFIITAAQKAKVPVIIETNVFGLVDESKTGRSIDHHLFVSKMCALRYQKCTGLSPKEFFIKNKVLYNPVNINDFNSTNISDIQQERIKQKFGLDNKAFIIGRVGRPDLGKWGDLCAKMMRYLDGKTQNIQYVIVGAPEQKIKKIQRNKTSSKSFIFLLPLSEEDLLEFYTIIDVLAHSSKMGESFGYTLAEAMAAQKPVVVNSTPLSDNAQIELVDNNKTGFIANSPQSYAEAITCLIHNRKTAQELGLGGYEKVQKQYNAVGTTRLLEKVYLDLLKQKGIQINNDLYAQLEHYSYFPSLNDIVHFETEYERRLMDFFGRNTLRYQAELFGYHHLIKYPFLITGYKKIIGD